MSLKRCLIHLNKTAARGAVQDPSMVMDGAPLDWTDGQMAAYMKQRFKRDTGGGRNRVKVAAEMEHTVQTLLKKDCIMGKFTLSLLINYYGRLGMWRKAWNTFQRHHGKMIFADQALFDSLLFAATKTRDFKEVEMVIRLAATHGVKISERGWNSALRVAIDLPDKNPTRKILKRIKSDLPEGSSHFSVHTYNVILRGVVSVEKTWQIYDSIVESGQQPDMATFGAMMHGIASHGDKTDISRLFKTIDSYGLSHKNNWINNELMRYFRRTGDLDGAFLLFEDVVDNADTDYNLSSPFVALFIGLCTQCSKRKGDRGDRLVDMAYFNAEKNGVLHCSRLMLAFLRHYGDTGRTTDAGNLVQRMEANGIKAPNDLHHTMYGSERKHSTLKDNNRTLCKVPDAGEHSRQMVTMLRQGKLSEVPPILARLAKRSSFEEKYILEEVGVLSAYAVLNEPIKQTFYSHSLSEQGLVLFILGIVMASSRIYTFSTPLIPEDLCTHFVKAESDLQTAINAVLVVSSAYSDDKRLSMAADETHRLQSKMRFVKPSRRPAPNKLRKALPSVEETVF
eukprot:TRINITY_DN30578_c0_g1_i1.p1 TRINITY_DN30578_c0_g1~~TRINITY_DN30578_c0_g1_i1.p1  ORF type:complete len:565 (+),score=90.11 TRINITY_DN30578_c0_g1_i1:41-1735(+)